MAKDAAVSDKSAEKVTVETLNQKGGDAEGQLCLSSSKDENDSTDNQNLTVECNTDESGKISRVPEKIVRNDYTEMLSDDQQNLLEAPETGEEGLNEGCREKEVDITSVSGNVLGSSEPEGGALWDIFRRQDVPKLEEYVKKHFKEFRHIYCNQIPQVVHPIHDQTVYLTVEHK
ncbi:hypothetical protein ABTG52_18225, partial [Acinetobacter baumannii]